MTTPTLPEELLALIFEQLAIPNDLEPPNDLDSISNDYGRFSQAQRQARAYQERTLARQQHISTLRNICLASKSLHRLAWPILYRQFCNRGAGEEDNNSSEDEYGALEDLQLQRGGHEYAASKLLRTICLRPDYGLALQSLTIRGWTPVEAMDGLELFELLQGDATVSALFQWRARRFWLGADHSIELAKQLHRALSLGLEDGLLTMLLLMCPNIKELDLAPSLDFGQSSFAGLLALACDRLFLAKPLPEPDHDFEQEEADYVIAQMFGTPWPGQKLSKVLVLQRLEALRIRSPGIVNMSVYHFCALLTLPSLRTLEADSFCGNLGFPYTAKEIILRYGKSPMLQSLALSSCRAESKEIVEIVELCPKLRQLSVVWQDFHMAAMSDDNLDDRWCLKHGNIAKAVAEHTPNLEMLELNASAGWPNRDATPKHPFIVDDSLDGLRHLVDLRLDDHAIYGSQYGTFGSSLGASVPKSVVSLTLYSEEPYDRRGLPVTVAWLKYQDDDLRTFLEDDTFNRLSSIYLAGRERKDILPPDAKHNWKAAIPTSSRNEPRNPGVLVNHERLDDLGVKLMSRFHGDYDGFEDDDDKDHQDLDIIDLVSDASDEA